MNAVQTILDIYQRDMIDLLYNEAVDLISLLNDEQLEAFYDQNPRFGDITSGDIKNIVDLKEMIDILVSHIMQQ